jgi:hypothetical protein
MLFNLTRRPFPFQEKYKREFMHIQINTDHHIAGGAGISAYFTKNLEETFGRFDGEIIRIEMYLTDVNGDKEGD